MNKQSNKGITLITLILVVVILIILGAVAVPMGIDVMEAAKFEGVETNLLLIRSKSKMMSESMAMGEITKEQLRGTEETSGWYRLSQRDLDELGIDKAHESDGYLVNYDSEDVYYEKGVTLDDMKFYKLSDILDYREKNEQGKNEIGK